jgi:hypothetical protein
MVRRRREAIGRSMGFVALLVGSTVCFADTIDSSVIGAWSLTQPDCARLFEHRGGGLAFRQPVDKFAQAAIIEPRQFILPSSVCQVQSVSHQKDAITVNAECNDSISYTPNTIQIKVKSAGEIVYSPNGDVSLDTTLIKCRL